MLFTLLFYSCIDSKFEKDRNGSNSVLNYQLNESRLDQNSHHAVFYPLKS